MAKFVTYTEESKKSYGVDLQNPYKDVMTKEQISIGCLQRIADATELMAQNHSQLIRDRDNYKAYWQGKIIVCQRMARRISALQGVITKLKKKGKSE